MDYSQKNIEQLFQLIGSMPNQVYRQTSHFDFIKCKDSVWPNQLINLKLGADNMKAHLHAIEKQVDSGAIPNLLMLNPNTDLDLVITALKHRQYRSSKWTAMTHDLEKLSPQKKIADFEIKLVENESDLQLWLGIANTELMNNVSLSTDIFNRLLKDENCYFYLGIENNKAVATSFLYTKDNHAGIYLVSTAKKHRKKGYGKALTQQCLDKAKVLRSNRVDIQATELGKPVYASLGFVDKGVINVFGIT